MLRAACLLTLISALPVDGPKLLVLNKSDANVSIIDVESGETKAKLEVGEGPHEAAVSPDGRMVVVCNYGAQQPGNTLSVIDMKSMEVAQTIELGAYTRPHGIAFRGDWELVVTAEAQQKLLLIDLEKGEVSAAIDTDQRASHMVTLTPDGKLAFVANISSSSVSVIDLEKKELVKVIPTDAGCEGIWAHPTRPEVWTTNRAGDTVSVIDTKTLEEVAKLECPAFPIRVAITPDGKHALVSCANSGDVAVFDVAERKLLRRIAMVADSVDDKERKGRYFANSPSASAPIGILIEPSGKRAYVANTLGDVVTVLDLEKWEVAGRLEAGRQPDGLAWSSYGD